MWLFVFLSQYGFNCQTKMIFPVYATAMLAGSSGALTVRACPGHEAQGVRSLSCSHCSSPRYRLVINAVICEDDSDATGTQCLLRRVSFTSPPNTLPPNAMPFSLKCEYHVRVVYSPPRKGTCPALRTIATANPIQYIMYKCDKKDQKVALVPSFNSPDW